MSCQSPPKIHLMGRSSPTALHTCTLPVATHRTGTHWNCNLTVSRLAERASFRVEYNVANWKSRPINGNRAECSAGEHWVSLDQFHRYMQ